MCEILKCFLYFCVLSSDRVAYLSLRVEEGTKKQAEEFPYDEGIITNPFITRSLQPYE
jgi:hypothetical protein